MFVLLTAMLSFVVLPEGPAPAPVPIPHFPDRLHAYVWRNWPLVPVGDLARVVGARPDDMRGLADAMGLGKQPPISEDQRRRSYITVIRRNWHLLPYDQLLDLLGWTEDQLAFTLREDDFLYIKLGLLKPKCERLVWSPPTAETRAREKAIAAVLAEAFPSGVTKLEEPPFAFVQRLAGGKARPAKSGASLESNRFSPRYCYSYFALYGDPLLDPETDPYPDPYLARLAEIGVDGVWLHGVLYKLAPFPWDESLSARYEERLDALRRLVQRAKRHGIRLYLYLNEPRAMPVAFFEARPHLKGVVENDHAALCTSQIEVQQYLMNAVASVSQAVPDLGGYFTITASENLTNCWSHGRGAACPRCGARNPADVIAEVNAILQAGIKASGNTQRFIAWDWGWGDDWAVDAIRRLPSGVSLMSVSEWSIPIRRGGIESIVGEYSISAIGPGPRATRHWNAVRLPERSRTLAKIQAGTTWEIGSVPYVPAVANVAQHVANLRETPVTGLMLGWTLGGFPSPNLEVVVEMGRETTGTPEQAMENVARRRFGPALAPAVVQAWHAFSAAFDEYPYHIGVMYNAPQHMGPANLLWGDPTGYKATMVGFPYDDLDAWHAVYPPEVFAAQFEKMADGFEAAIAELKHAAADLSSRSAESRALAEEINVAEACAIHFRSVANQTRFVHARRALAEAATREAAQPHLAVLENVLNAEIELAKRLFAVQARDSRIGFEATNHYFYVPMDLAEKVINCRDLLGRWLPAQRARFD